MTVEPISEIDSTAGFSPYTSRRKNPYNSKNSPHAARYPIDPRHDSQGAENLLPIHSTRSPSPLPNPLEEDEIIELVKH